MAIDKELWDKAKVLFELGKSLNEIELETNIPKGTISKKSKKENWHKSKIQPLKADIVDYEKKKETLDAQKGNLLEKIATLSDFEITILSEVVEDEAKKSTLVISNASLALIRTNQMLTKNKKTIMSKTEIYEDGKRIATEYIEKEVPLTMTDYKESVELTDKASLTLGVNERHAKSQVEVNTQATAITGVQLIDA